MNRLTKLFSSGKALVRRWPTIRKAQAGFVFALLCVGMIGTLAFRSVDRLRSDEEWVKHTQEVISALRLLTSHLADSEAAERGAAIAEQESDLDPGQAAFQKMATDLQTLRHLTADNTAQQSRLDRATPLVAQYTARLGEEIELQRRRGLPAAAAATGSKVSRRLHDEIHGLVAEMEAAEQTLLQQRQRQAAHSGALARAIIIGGSILALGLLFMALFAVEKDIARRQAQAALAGRLGRMGAWSVKLPAFQVSWSDEICAIHEVPMGFTPLVADALDYYAPEYRETISLAVRACARAGTPFDLELEIITARGRRVWVRSIGEAVRNAAGVIRRIQGAFQDISERRRSEESLRTAEEDFRTMANHISQLAWMADAKGDIFWYNDRWFENTGTTWEEMAGWGWQKVIHPDHGEQVLDKIRGCFQSGEVWDDTFPLRGRDGVYRWFLSRAVPIRDAEGKVLRWFGTNTDITAIKALEADLAVARDQALESVRMKSEFLANMSHEIRTPMNGIIGMTDLVLDTKLDRVQREYLGMAKTSAHALLRLINDILDFSKIEAGKLELEEIGFSLRECIDTMLKPLGMRADQKGLEVTADLPAKVPDHLVGDPMRLQQILLNLLDNAIKFTERGDVMLRVAIESIADGTHLLHFTVTDTGIGIPKSKLALIFEAFAQVDGSTTRHYGGTGLGLTIASQIVRQMSGRLWVESTVGQGSAFHFTARFPVRPPPAPGVRSDDPRQLDGLRVLVVDDNAVNRRILREILKNWRMRPTVVASGAEALAKMLAAAHSAQPFPLVILDGMMPEMDGFMVVEQIRARAELTGTKVVMLSSAMPAGVAARCQELRIVGYLTKPVSQSELLHTILAAIGEAVTLEPVVDAAPVERAASGLRILLAEDNLINRALATALLEKRGHSLVHAGNGREAVAAAAHEAFDLILIDVQMPEMDGFEATRRIRESEQATGRHTPIAAMTAHTMTGDRERCLAAGMDDYLSKPLQKAALAALLERIADDRNPADAIGRRP